MFDIITIGSAAKDIFLQGIGFVNFNSKKFKTGKGICLNLASKNNVSKADLLNGGSAVNTAVTFSRQELKSAAILRIGDDLFGKDILRFLKKEKTAFSVVFVDKNGERTILDYKGAGRNINEKEISWDKIKTHWFYVGTLGGNKQFLEKIFSFAKKNKIKIAGNPSLADLKILKNNQSLLKNYDIFLVNQEEASYLTDIPYIKEKEIFKKLDKLVDGIVVMTKGAKGVSVSDGKNIYKAGIFPQKAIDRTGAGDAFGSGFVSGLIKESKDYKIEKSAMIYAIRLGLANATSVVENIGANQGILTKNEFEKNKRWYRKQINLETK